MNKQELFEKIDGLNKLYGETKNYVAVDDVLNLVKLLDEPQKVTVPQFVADWYEEHKDNLEYNIWDWMKYNLEPKKRENAIFSQWLGKTVNNPVETLIKMKLYGYTVEKEPKHTVKLKNTDDYLVKTNIDDYHFYNNIYTNRRKHTRKEIENAGFGWVFDCPGVEIEEVEG